MVVAMPDAPDRPMHPTEDTRPMWHAIRRARRRPSDGGAVPARASGGDTAAPPAAVVDDVVIVLGQVEVARLLVALGG